MTEASVDQATRTITVCQGLFADRDGVRRSLIGVLGGAMGVFILITTGPTTNFPIIENKGLIVPIALFLVWLCMTGEAKECVNIERIMEGWRAAEQALPSEMRTSDLVNASFSRWMPTLYVCAYVAIAGFWTLLGMSKYGM